MKKLLLLIGVVAIIACILSLLLALANIHAYNNLFDGTPEHYNRLHQKAIVFFIATIVLALIGTACIIFYNKM